MTSADIVRLIPGRISARGEPFERAAADEQHFPDGHRQRPPVTCRLPECVTGRIRQMLGRRIGRPGSPAGQHTGIAWAPSLPVVDVGHHHGRGRCHEQVLRAQVPDRVTPIVDQPHSPGEIRGQHEIPVPGGPRERFLPGGRVEHDPHRAIGRPGQVWHREADISVAGNSQRAGDRPRGPEHAVGGP